MKTLRWAALAALSVLPLASHAVEFFGTTTHTMIRGAVPGSFAGWYGGDFPGVFPVPFTEAEARAAIVGAPDGRFLSLPGEPPGPPGSPFPGAYAEVSFGFDFGPNSTLKLWELGDSSESAQLFLWSNNGGNVQLQVTRGASDVIAIDLNAYAGALASIGGTAFTKVGIGGLDRRGGSEGFDLDAVSITPIPEPQTYALMALGLAAMGAALRGRRRRD